MFSRRVLQKTAERMIRASRAQSGSKRYLSLATRSRLSSRRTAGLLGGAILSSVALFYANGTQNPVLQETAKQGVTPEQVKQHTTVEKGIWVVINGDVYDLTNFLSVHPGGASVIEKYAGKNASKIYNKFHGPNFIEKYLSPEDCLGPLIGEMEEAVDVTETGGEQERQILREHLPPLSDIFNLNDFEYIAKKVCSPSAWYYYSCGSDDEVTLRENHNAFSRIYFKPRVLVDVAEVDLSTSMLGTPTTAPFYISATAQAKLGHPDGELSIARGCDKEGIIQMISHFPSHSVEDIFAQASEKHNQWYQLYVMGRDAAMASIDSVTKLGARALFVTVDTPELGRREKDMKLRARWHQKMKALEDDSVAYPSDSESGKQQDDSHGEQNALDSNVVYGRDYLVTWKDIADFQKRTSIPVVPKGVQTVEDIVLAAQKGVKAVVLSNHGGRQLDYSRAPVEVLADAMPVLKEMSLDDKIEIYIDGGVRRGGDVIKCLALGAKGVGLGRVFLYANSAYGEAGVRRAIQMLKEEIRMNMRLLGVSKLSELGPQHLDLRNLHARVSPRDNSYYNNYEPLSPPLFTNEK